MKKIFFLFQLLLLSSVLYSQPVNPPILYPVNGGNPVYSDSVAVFKWSNVSTATSYRFLVFLGASHVMDTVVVDTFKVTPPYIFNSNCSYYWTVAAINSSGQGPYASYFYFTTASSPPNAPTLISPPDSSLVPVSGVTFDWSDVAGADSYRIQISTSPNFSSTILNIGGLTNSGYSLQSGYLSYNIKYYWRVSASNSSGTSPWSSVWRVITIQAPPPAPTIYPVNRGKPVYADSATIFEWRKLNTATSYRIQISTATSFQNPTVDSTVNDSIYIAPPFTFNNYSHYYWRVGGINNGGQGLWSTAWDFYVNYNPPNPPALVYPMNNSINISLTPTLDWNLVAGATGYRVQVSQYQDFNNLKVNATITSSQYTVSSGVLSNNTKYYWRVYSTNSIQNSNWSEVWNFTTVNQIGVTQISSEIPAEYKLFDNYPNPFNPNTIIRFQIKDSRLVTLKVFDILGREVEILVNEKQTPGTYEVNFNASNLPSGIYFYTIRSGDFSDTKRMLLIK